MQILESRRRLLSLSTGSIAASFAVPLLAACGGRGPDAREVLAVEDLMREHGVLRRALLIYAEAAMRLRAGRKDIPTDALASTAALFRSFGEEYHERKLEEGFVFPAVARAGGGAAALPAVLKVQHDRGREVTDYVIAVAHMGRISPGNAGPLSNTLDGFVRMYQHHAAIEDTVVFPAWKAALSADEYEHLSDKFEDLEKQMFGKDGFEDAVPRIGLIEQAFGLADLSGLTAPPAPAPVT